MALGDLSGHEMAMLEAPHVDFCTTDLVVRGDASLDDKEEVHVIADPLQRHSPRNVLDCEGFNEVRLCWH